MKNFLFRLPIFISCCFILCACNPEQSPVLTREVTPDILPNEAITAVPSQTAFSESSPHQHFQTNSGLTIDQYQLKEIPAVDPLLFEPILGSQDEILSIHAAEKKELFVDNSFFENSLPGKKAFLNGKELVAQEIISNTPSGTNQTISIDLSLDKKSIYTIEGGDVSPTNSLQGLWTYDGHWMLEIAYVTKTVNSQENDATFNVTGQIVQDGELLNEKLGYQEAFNAQIINGKPFYFFKKDGEIGISYGNQTTLLGFDEVPHYKCCSAAEMNPRSAQTMVSFFAEKKGTWYYVEIGTFK